MARVIAMPNRDKPKDASPQSAWGALGYESEREMLIADLVALDGRIKSASTSATAVAALSRRKQEVLEQIKALDSGGEEDLILDESEDEPWDVGD
jgi:hypothetical protein